MFWLCHLFIGKLHIQNLLQHISKGIFDVAIISMTTAAVSQNIFILWEGGKRIIRKSENSIGEGTSYFSSSFFFLKKTEFKCCMFSSVFKIRNRRNSIFEKSLKKQNSLLIIVFENAVQFFLLWGLNFSEVHAVRANLTKSNDGHFSYHVVKGHDS